MSGWIQTEEGCPLTVLVPYLCIHGNPTCIATRKAFSSVHFLTVLRPVLTHALLVVRKMGKIVGVVHGVSVVSICSADGANSEFKKLCEIAFQVKKVWPLPVSLLLNFLLPCPCPCFCPILSPKGRTVRCARCAKSRLFSTIGSHGPQGPEFCTPMLF